MVTVDLNRNAKQKAYFFKVLQCLAEYEQIQEDIKQGKCGPWPFVPIRFWHYGGAIRGGKTVVSFAILAFVLCKKYPGSRWHVIRASWSDLKLAMDSLRKIIHGARVRWRNSTDECYVEFLDMVPKNGTTPSRVYFKSENAARDKDLDGFKGLETNGFLGEQIEELMPATFNKMKERAGSYYIDPMPPAYVFTTFNPTYNWVKEMIHDKNMDGTLDLSHFVMYALSSDGDWVTQDQMDSWNQMDEESKARFILGSWEFKVEGQFAYAFGDHLIEPSIDINSNIDIWLSFDFNVDPMTCVVMQTDYASFVHFPLEFRIPNSDTYALCEEINRKLGHLRHRFIVTGDASGNNRNSAARGGQSHYQIIQEQLKISSSQFKMLSSNPLISVSRVFCNSVLQKFPRVRFSKVGCPYLIKDLRFVMTGKDEEGKLKIQKTGWNKLANVDNALLGHLLDGWRYVLHKALPSWLRIPKS